jgi:hypothetical protein
LPGPSSGTFLTLEEARRRLLLRVLSGLDVVRALIDKNILQPGKIEASDVKDFIDVLLGCGSGALLYLEELINGKKLENLSQIEGTHLTNCLHSFSGST